MIETVSTHQFKELISKKEPCIMIFSADWCPDCMYLKPYLPEIVKNNPEFAFYLVNRDDNPELCEELDVLGIPSLLAFENGCETGRFVSKLRKSPEEIQQFLNNVKEEIK